MGCIAGKISNIIVEDCSNIRGHRTSCARQFIGSAFFVWSSPLGERRPNENDVAVLCCQTPLNASQIETRGNLNTTKMKVFAERWQLFFFRRISVFLFIQSYKK